MEQKLLETLQIIGLTIGESKTYLALLSIGTSTVGPIIEHANISASKAYVILDRLIDKGLVSTVVDQKVKLFSALPPEKIISYLDEEKKRIQHHKESIEMIMPTLKAKRDSVSKFPPIELSKGRKGFEAFFSEMLESAKSSDSYMAIAEKRISFFMQHLWFELNNILLKRNIPSKVVYEYAPWIEKDPQIHQRKNRTNYFPRVLDKNLTDLPAIYVIGNKCILSDLDDAGEIFTLLIRNKNLVNTLKKTVSIFYDLGKVPKGFNPLPS